VLLAGVNDDPDVLEDLCRRLVEARVRPYYVLQCDRVRGTERFWVDLGRAMEIVSSLQRVLPGHAVPFLVVDLPGRGGKARIAPHSRVERTDGGWLLESPEGSDVFYPDSIP